MKVHTYEPSRMTYVTGGNVIRDGLLFKPDNDVVIRDGGRPNKDDFSHH